MDKAKSAGISTSKADDSLKDQVVKAAEQSGIGTPWIRDDGAVCFGNECVVFSKESDGQLRMEVHPDECGAAQGEALLGYLVAAGKGVHIVVPPGTVKQK
jgi:hypothetical protein